MKLSSCLPCLPSGTQPAASPEPAAALPVAQQPQAHAMGPLPPSRQSAAAGHARPRNAALPGGYPHTLATRTTYPLRPEQLAPHELQVNPNDGRVYQNGRRFSTGAHEESRFVMDSGGRIFADRPERVEVTYPDNHSSFLAGKPAAAAGELTAHDGVIESINNMSGHYKPEPKHTQQVLQELGGRGVDTSRIQRADR